MNFDSLQWLFPVVLTLHNLEEAIWFPDWTRQAGRWHAPVSQRVFRFAAAVFTLLAFGVTWLSAASGKQTIWAYLTFGYMVAVLANVLIPHLAVTVAMRRYMPGLATGVALNLPTLSLLVILALRQGYVSGWKAAEYSVSVILIGLLLIPALFKLGRLLNL